MHSLVFSHLGRNGAFVRLSVAVDTSAEHERLLHPPGMVEIHVLATRWSSGHASWVVQQKRPLTKPALLRIGMTGPGVAMMVNGTAIAVLRHMQSHVVKDAMEVCGKQKHVEWKLWTVEFQSGQTGTLALQHAVVHRPIGSGKSIGFR